MKPTPQYAVIFTSQRTPAEEASYEAMANKMIEMVQRMPGFISADSVRDANGLGVTISYWSSVEAIKQWKTQTEHLKAQELGKTLWYSSYSTSICRIEEAYNYPLEISVS